MREAGSEPCPVARRAGDVSARRPRWQPRRGARPGRLRGRYAGRRPRNCVRGTACGRRERTASALAYRHEARDQAGSGGDTRDAGLGTVSVARRDGDVSARRPRWPTDTRHTAQPSALWRGRREPVRNHVTGRSAHLAPCTSAHAASTASRKVRGRSGIGLRVNGGEG